jgi:hypothetical protein
MAQSVRPVTYDGVTWNVDSMNPTYLALVEGLDEAAETSGDDEEPVGDVGMFERNHPVRLRRITLEGRVLGQGATDLLKAASYRSQVNAIKAAFEAGVTKTLSVALEDGSTATINARTEGRDFTPLVAWAARVTIVLISVDPEWVIT